MLNACWAVWGWDRRQGLCRGTGRLPASSTELNKIKPNPTALWPSWAKHGCLEVSQLYSALLRRAKEELGQGQTPQHTELPSASCALGARRRRGPGHTYEKVLQLLQAEKGKVSCSPLASCLASLYRASFLSRLLFCFFPPPEQFPSAPPRCNVGPCLRRPEVGQGEAHRPTCSLLGLRLYD